MSKFLLAVVVAFLVYSSVTTQTSDNAVHASESSVDYDAIFADVVRQEHETTRQAIADGVDEIKELLQPRTIPEAKPAKVVKPAVRVVEASPLAAIADSYNGTRWSHPGDIDSHLTGSNHGVSVSELNGLSNAQKERLHSSLHQSGQPKAYASRVVTHPTRTVSSGCPGGVCPVNRSSSVRSYSSQRRGLFSGGGLFGRRR